MTGLTLSVRDSSLGRPNLGALFSARQLYGPKHNINRALWIALQSHQGRWVGTPSAEHRGARLNQHFTRGNSTLEAGQETRKEAFEEGLLVDRTADRGGNHSDHRRDRHTQLAALTHRRQRSVCPGQTAHTDHRRDYL